MPKEENIFDMTAEAFAEKHPGDVKAWQDKAAAKATEAAQDAERQRFAALETAFPDHPGFVAAQFKAGSTVEQAKVAFSDVLTKELAAEKQARIKAEEEAAAAKNGSQFRASDREPEGGKTDAGDGEGEKPKTFMAALDAYKKANPKASARDAGRETAKAYPELYEKHRKGE